MCSPLFLSLTYHVSVTFLEQQQQQEEEEEEMKWKTKILHVNFGTNYAVSNFPC